MRSVGAHVRRCDGAGKHASGSEAILVAIPLLGILGLSGWLAFIRPELLPLASAYAAKTVCSNVFIAKRDADPVIRTDVQFAEHRVVKLMKIDVDTANRRHLLAELGFRQAQGVNSFRHVGARQQTGV